MRSQWPHIVLAVWICGWALVQAQVSWQTALPDGPRSFNSPDETANYFFSRRIGSGLPVAAPAVPDDASGVVHPRSMLVYRGRLVPATFLGLPVWYGQVGRLAGVGVLPYLTPVIAAIGVFAFYYLLRQWFAVSVAWWSAALMPLVPPWWYYSARGLFHNVPFLALLLLGGGGLASGFKRRQRIPMLLGGAALGAALSLRPSEAVWVLPLCAIAGGYHRRQLGGLGVAGAGALFAALPVLLHQAATFGSPFGTGYLLPAAHAADGASSVVAALVPFGFHPRRALGNGFRFIFLLLPALAWPAALGGLVAAARWRRLPAVQRWYLGATVLAAGWLVAYYGSAELSDNLDPAALTLGVSYVRYWLPVYLALLPLAVIGANALLRLVRNRWVRTVTLTGVLAGMSWWSVQLTVREPRDGLAAAVRAVQAGYRKRAAVVAQVPPGAIIVTERSDKIFFPALAVMPTLFDHQVQLALPELLTHYPVYWYTFMDDQSIAPLRQQLLPQGVALADPVVIDRREAAPERLFSLRQLTP